MTSKFIYYLNRERTEYKLGLTAKLQLIGTSANLSKQCKLNKPPTYSALSCLLSQRTVEDVYFNLKNTKSKYSTKYRVGPAYKLKCKFLIIYFKALVVFRHTGELM